MADTPERDSITGRTTTGHEWDGIKELNTPLPKWWVYVFYATIAWAIVFWVLFPTWPSISSFDKGLLGWDDHAELRKETELVAAERNTFRDRIAPMSVAEIENDPDLLAFAMASGQAIFNETCSPCHQIGGVGIEGYPSLVDDKWIWGGSAEQIYQTIRYGVRSDNPKTRDPDKAGMQAFGGILSTEEIDEVADYVATALSQGKDGQDMPGRKIFVDNCVVCHGENGQGSLELGAPPLNVAIGWTYRRGNEPLKQTVARQVTNPQKGSMPDWSERLSDPVIKELSVYVRTLSDH